MTKYVARLNGEIVGTRKTDRVYTHAIVVNGHDKTNHVITWCGRLDLAQGEQRKAQRYGYTADIVSVEIASSAPLKALHAVVDKAIANGAPVIVEQRAPVTVGTSYFVSLRAANAYYAQYGERSDDVLRKIIAGEVHIGKPELKPGQTLSIIDSITGARWDGRYAITE